MWLCQSVGQDCGVTLKFVFSINSCAGLLKMLFILYLLNLVSKGGPGGFAKLAECDEWFL